MRKKDSPAPAGREIFMIEPEISQIFRELATAKGMKKADLFRELILESAEKNKVLLQKWRELEALRKK